MTQIAVGEGSRSVAAKDQAALPYPPSWVDRVMAAIRRLPLPYGIAYLILFVLEAFVLHVLGWIDGSLPRFSFERLYFLFPLWLAGPLAIMTYLDDVALQALREFQPLLPTHGEEIPRLEYELTTLPARSVLVSGLFWAATFLLVMYVGFPAMVRTYSYGTIAILSAWIFGLLSFVTGSAIYYHTLRQLRLVSRILGLVERVNLFHLDPVYAFARLTARTGVSWLFLAGVTLAIFPFDLINITVIALYGVMVLFALGAFVLPLWSVHQRLVAEKRRLLAGVNRRLEATIERLNQSLDDDDLARVKEIDGALAGLRTQRTVLAEIPTWPWSVATFSGFVSALLLPIVLFLVQVVLRKWLGI